MKSRLRGNGIFLAAIFFFAIHAHAGDLVIGEPAPPIVLTPLDGTPIDTRSLRGQVVIVTFWATWCEPCREELPILSRYARDHAAQGLVVLGFSLDAPEQKNQVASIATGLSFPVGFLGDPHVAGYGRIWHLPVSFTIDRQGRLASNGWREKDPVWTAEKLERIVTPLLGDAARDSGAAQH